MVGSLPRLPSSSRSARFALVLALCGACVAIAAHAAGPRQSDLPISLDAASSDFDYRNNTLRFRQVRIVQGTVRVEADEATATGLNFENSRWEFRGNVRIDVEGGSLASNDAQVTFVNNQIATAVITGSPATFEQQLQESDDIAKGRAGRIEYDFTAGNVQLMEDAYLTDGRNDIHGQKLVYSIRDQRVLAEASEQGQERVRITINPRSMEGEQKKPGADRPQ
ncbi:MAG TPA: lipopolysaccharide transport periplasmic protein LptA [Steroidobacteraceae bacterium]|nr:lipopolysaccharide transport periplasmic protein LptA [Steroidobacteraceae bacterium]